MTVPLYQGIAKALAQKISSGDWPVGTVVPTEHQLMAQHGVSRNTIRAALKQLQDLGMVSRRRNRGTLVEGAPSTGTFTQSLTSLDDLVNLAQTATREIGATRKIVLDVALSRELGCAAGSSWLHMTMVRREAGAPVPLGWTDAYIDPHYTAVRRLAVQHPERLLCDLIEAHGGRPIVTVDQTVTACAIPPDVATQLAVSAQEPGLKIMRHYRDATQAPVLITRSYYPGGRYALTTTLVRRR